MDDVAKMQVSIHEMEGIDEDGEDTAIGEAPETQADALSVFAGKGIQRIILGLGEAGTPRFLERIGGIMMRGPAFLY